MHSGPYKKTLPIEPDEGEDAEGNVSLAETPPTLVPDTSKPYSLKFWGPASFPKSEPPPPLSVPPPSIDLANTSSSTPPVDRVGRTVVPKELQSPALPTQKLESRSKGRLFIGLGAAATISLVTYLMITPDNPSQASTTSYAPAPETSITEETQPPHTSNSAHWVNCPTEGHESDAELLTALRAQQPRANAVLKITYGENGQPDGAHWLAPSYIAQPDLNNFLIENSPPPMADPGATRCSYFVVATNAEGVAQAL